MSSGFGFEVPGKSRRDIRSAATQFRALIGWEEAYFPIVEVLEFVMPRLLPGFTLLVASNDEMGDDHGLTYPQKKLIVVREDVYERACAGRGRDRSTLAHELGHLVLHSDVALARAPAKADIKPYRHSEWQANCFAGELLVSHRHIRRCRSAAEAALMFGVSKEAADVQWRAFQKDGLLK